MKIINDAFRHVTRLNEVGDDSPYEFSDPDGVRSGKSGWSFGDCQFDIANNDQAAACLKDCGFTDGEIKGLIAQTVDVKKLNPRLESHAHVIDEYADRQLKYCIDGAAQFVEKYRIPVDAPALLALADTINQYGSLGEGSGNHLAGLKRPITAQDVLAMKLTWKYSTSSKHGHDDTVRRYNNLMKVVSNEL